MQMREDLEDHVVGERGDAILFIWTTRTMQRRRRRPSRS
jgi:hypothetical protein